MLSTYILLLLFILALVPITDYKLLLALRIECTIETVYRYKVKPPQQVEN